VCDASSECATGLCKYGFCTYPAEDKYPYWLWTIVIVACCILLIALSIIYCYAKKMYNANGPGSEKGSRSRKNSFSGRDSLNSERSAFLSGEAVSKNLIK
jgi:hypothetical protein